MNRTRIESHRLQVGVFVFADRSAASTATLTGWSLEIMAIPEPVNVALGCFTGVFLVVTLIRSQRMR